MVSVTGWSELPLYTINAEPKEVEPHIETPLAHEWEHLHEATANLAWEILKEPTRNATDFAAKLSVWDRCIWDKNTDSDDITNKSGWMDHASNRLLTDARQVLGLPLSSGGSMPRA